MLHRLGRIPAGDVVQACGAGLLPVTVSAAGTTLTGGVPTYGEPVDPLPLLAAVGLSPEDLAGPAPRWAGAGLEFAFLLVHSGALATARPDQARMAALGGAGVCVAVWDGAAAGVRVFAGGAGVPEDPATGSAALGLGVHLDASGLLPDGTSSYVVRQGVGLGRPSTLRCTVHVSGGRAVRVTVSGDVVPVARGEVRVPPA